MSDADDEPQKPYILDVPIISLDPKSLRGRIWEAIGLDIGDKDPLHAAQVIYVAAMEDQARLLDSQAKRMDKLFGDYLKVFHSETESIVIGIKDEINSQAISERMSVMSEQISRSDKLAASISKNASLFKLLTFINLLSLLGALTILFFVLK